MDDIKESIAELKYFKEHIFKVSKSKKWQWMKLSSHDYDSQDVVLPAIVKWFWILDVKRCLI